MYVMSADWMLAIGTVRHTTGGGGGAVTFPYFLEHMVVSDECEKPIISMVGRPFHTYCIEYREGLCGIFNEEFHPFHEADIDVVVLDSGS